MNWKVRGKGATGRNISLTIVGGPDDEAAARKQVKASRPSMTITEMIPLDGNLRPRVATPAPQIDPPATQASPPPIVDE